MLVPLARERFSIDFTRRRQSNNQNQLYCNLKMLRRTRVSGWRGGPYGLPSPYALTKNLSLIDHEACRMFRNPSISQVSMPVLLNCEKENISL